MVVVVVGAVVEVAASASVAVVVVVIVVRKKPQDVVMTKIRNQAPSEHKVTRVMFDSLCFDKILQMKVKDIGERIIARIIPFFCTVHALSPTSKHTPLTPSSFLYRIMYA